MTRAMEKMPANGTPGQEAANEIQDLIRRCIARDDDAKAAFINRYGDLVQRAVTHRLLSMANGQPVQSDAEDLRNDILERLLENDCKKLATLKNSRCINAWLVSISRNHVAGHLRKCASRTRAKAELAREEQTCPSAPTPAEVAMQNELSDSIREQLAALPVGEKMVVQLYFMQQLKYSEIAEITGLNINTVASRLHRAKMKLRKMLNQIKTSAHNDNSRGDGQNDA